MKTKLKSMNNMTLKNIKLILLSFIIVKITVYIYYMIKIIKNKTIQINNRIQLKEIKKMKIIGRILKHINPVKIVRNIEF